MKGRKNVAEKMGGDMTAKLLAHDFGELSQARLTASKKGAEGGVWLTEEGKSLATKLKQPRQR